MNEPKITVRLSDIKAIRQLSSKTINELRKINRSNDRAYAGKELTKDQLIFQIVFCADAPDKDRRYNQVNY